ncbi:MAG: MBL fold metallo-hydrolase [Alphaproteobacteria bacterium]|nr:MBL fold metallo-hydrolase [Alphaproteobacteria bacterium]
MDGTEEVAEPKTRSKLVYPSGDPPEAGETKEVAPGVLWVRMPLPFALKWINLWLIEDGDSWTLIDTGIAMEESRAHWRTILSSPALKGKPVGRVLITHMHPDHVGLAGWMTRKFQCRLWISRLEYVMCRMLVDDTGREAPEDGVRFYRAAGWDEDALDSYRVRFGGFGKAVSRLPDAFRRIADGETIEIGGRPWRVIGGNGHSPEHTCLLQPDMNIFISGDQLLPRISSNVSVFPTEPEADPLQDWLDSCAKLKAALPEDVLTLPAHNEPFIGAHSRLQDLIDGHERTLDRVHQRLQQQQRRVVDLFGALFARAIGPDVVHMATGETIAHLNCLIARGRARRTTGADGVDLYDAA